MFGEIVGKVLNASFSKDMELLLSCSVANPVEVHVHHFGFVLCDCIVKDDSCTFVVKLKGCWILLVAEYVTNGNWFFGVYE